jgi:hypothetical protein
MEDTITWIAFACSIVALALSVWGFVRGRRNPDARPGP